MRDKETPCTHPPLQLQPTTLSCPNKADLMRCYPRALPATVCQAQQFINLAHAVTLTKLDRNVSEMGCISMQPQTRLFDRYLIGYMAKIRFSWPFPRLAQDYFAFFGCIFSWNLPCCQERREKGGKEGWIGRKVTIDGQFWSDSPSQVGPLSILCCIFPKLP